MKPKTLEVEGLRSFYEKQVFTFPERHGLYYMTGRNIAEPGLHANGTGKSSFWDAYCWLLTGKTMRGLKAGVIGSGFDDKTKIDVSATVEVYGTDVHLRRTRNPNHIYKDGEILDQEGLEHFLGLDHMQIIHSLLIGQHHTHFFDMTPGQRMDFLTPILKLEMWEQARTLASKKVKELEDEVGSIEREKASLAATQEATEQNISAWEEAAKRWGQEHADEAQELENELQELLAETYDCEAEVADLKERADSEYEKVKEVSAEIKKLKDQRDGLAEERQDYRDELGAHDREIKRLNKLIKDVKGLMEEQTCSRCGQPIDEEHQQAEIKALKRSIKEIESAQKEDEEGLSDIEESMEDVDIQLDSLKAEKEKHSNKSSHLRQEAQSIEKEQERQTARITGVEQKIERHGKKRNPHKKEVREARAELEQVKEDLSKADKRLRAKSSSLERNRYWTKGFKSARLYVAHQAVKALELEVNGALSSLGLGDWAIFIDVERETKKGSLEKGVFINIQSPYNDKPVPWEVWSGGESARLAISGTLGLSNLIQEMCGHKADFLVLDEPSQHLSPEGVADAVTMLKEHAHRRGKQIWLVEHNSLDSGDFDGSVTIEKTTEGSRIVEG